MKLNKEKLDQMVEAVNQGIIDGDIIFVDQYTHLRFGRMLKDKLTPFCMEMTDEEIENECDKQSALITDADEAIGWDNAFMMGANFVRDGK